MSPDLTACLAGICAAAVVLAVVELFSARGDGSRWRPVVSVRALVAGCCVVLALCLLGPVLGLGATLAGWQAAAFAPRLRASALRRQVDQSFPEFAAALAAALAAGLKPVDALMLVATHRSDALGIAVRSACTRVEAGESLSAALAVVQRECPSARVTALVGVLESGASRGTDIVEAVSSLALSARGSQLAARRERAAKAGPLIQLVVALGLVPSVLLLIAAVAIARGLGTS